MPSPFPGMDPYLEDRQIWSDLHPSLIPAIRDALTPQVAPGNDVAIEQRVTTVEVARGEGVRDPDAATVSPRPGPLPSGGVALAEAPAATAYAVAAPHFEKTREGRGVVGSSAAGIAGAAGQRSIPGGHPWGLMHR